MSIIASAFAVAWNELQLVFKDRGALAIFFLLPLFLGGMMASMNLAAGSSGEAAILLKVGLVNQDTGPFGAEVVNAVGAIKELSVAKHATVAGAEEQVAKGQATAAIAIPAGFSRDIDAYKPTSIDVTVDPGQPQSASIVTGIMKQVAAEVALWGEVQYGVRNLMEQSGALAGATPQEKGAAQAQTLGVIMTTLNDLRRTPAIAVRTEDLQGAATEGGWGPFFAILFPGFTVMFIFFTTTASSSCLLRDREAGVLRRLMASPVARGAIIAGQMLAYVILACLQVTVLFAVGRVLFGMPLGQSPLVLILLTFIVGLTAASLGMMIGSLAKTAAQASGASLMASFVLAGLGGCLVSSPKLVTRSEGLLGILSNLTPQGHALDAYYSVLAENAGLLQVLPQMAILLGLTVVFFFIATKRFQFV